jgi:hypothetical protein
VVIGAQSRSEASLAALSDACAAQAEIKAAGLADVESDSWCDCLFLAQVDIKGWIPTWLGTWSPVPAPTQPKQCKQCAYD